jgi:lipopolysaccharide transport system permease protein
MVIKQEVKKRTEDEKWDMIIEPYNNVFDLKLKDVWQYRDLLWLLVRRDFVSFYKQTILGPLWFFIQPLLTTIMFHICFWQVSRYSTDDLPPALFYWLAITAWNYFADCLTKTSTVFKDNANIFGKVYFPGLSCL